MLLQLIKKFTRRTAHIFAIDVDFLEIFLQLLERTKPGFPGHMTPQEAILNQVGEKSIFFTKILLSMYFFEVSLCVISHVWPVSVAS